MKHESTGAAHLSSKVFSTLAEVAQLERVWKRGLVHSGGPHYRLRGTFSPISIGEDELQIFGRLIEEFRPENCFIIGNAFGVSSVYIAKAMERCGGRAVVTLDNKSEGNGELCFNVAAGLRARMEADILTNKVGSSPQDVAVAADDEAYDLIFIDGLHSHPQVTQDYQAVRDLARDDSILCWHDYWWIPGVPESVEAAEDDGFLCLKVNSSCEMVFGTKSRETYERLGRLFQNSEKPRKRRPGIMLYLKMMDIYLRSLYHKWRFTPWRGIDPAVGEA